MSEVGYECRFGMGARRLGVKTTEHDTEIISGKTKLNDCPRRIGMTT